MDIIKELGLTVHKSSYELLSHSNIYNQDMVLVKDLRAALDKLPVVYGVKGPLNVGSEQWSEMENRNATHKARLLCVEKIVKELLKVEFELDLTEADLGVANDNLSDEQFKSLTGKKWKVVATEIQEGE